MILQYPKRYIKRWALFMAIFFRRGDLKLQLPNLTLDENESIIIHSPAGAETSIAIKVHEDKSSLRALFSPPAIDINYVDVNNHKIAVDEFFKSQIFMIMDKRM